MNNFRITIGAVLLLLSSSLAATAQTQKYEVGGHIFSFQGKQLGNGFGVGGRFTYNLTRHVGIDAELNELLDDEGRTYAVQGFAGVKVGVRNKFAGAFVKARPGFMTNFAKPAPNYATTFNYERLDRFAFDAGAVFEGYLTPHLTLRADFSDIIVPFGNEQVLAPTPVRLGTTHKFQFSLGLGIRF